MYHNIRDITVKSLWYFGMNFDNLKLNYFRVNNEGDFGIFICRSRLGSSRNSKCSKFWMRYACIL